MGNAGVVTIYRLKVSLRGISPMIWRRLLVPDDLTLYGLHRVIQIAVGWEDYHLHAFGVHGRRYDTMMSGERHYHADGREIRLADLELRLRQRILYDYDFGDLWEHDVRVESALEPEPGKFYPVCLGGARAGPPEDSGGPGGYHALLDRLPVGEDDDDCEFEDDDPLAAFNSERFNRCEVNAELRREFATAQP